MAQYFARSEDKSDLDLLNNFSHPKGCIFALGIISKGSYLARIYKVLRQDQDAKIGNLEKSKVFQLKLFSFFILREMRQKFT